MSEEQREFERKRRRSHFGKETNRFMTKESPDRRAKTMSFFNAVGKRRMERGLSKIFMAPKNRRR